MIRITPVQKREINFGQRGIFLIILLFFFAAFDPIFLPAASPDRYLPYDGTYYKEIIGLYRESGQILPTLDQPWSYRQTEWLLNRLDISLLSHASLKTIEQLSQNLSSKPLYSDGFFSFDSRPSLTIEGTLPVVLTESDSVAVKPYPWDISWNTRQSLINLPLVLAVGNHLYAESLFEIRQEPSIPEKEPSRYTNVPAEAYDIYLKIPRRAYVNAGDSHWEISFGRTRPKWGAGETGTLLLSGNADWMTGLRARVYFDHFSYTWYTANLSPWFVTGTDPLSSTEKTKQPKAEKWFFGHSFEVTLGKKVYLALREAYLYGGSAPVPLDLFNPIMALHNTYLKGTSGETYISGDYNVGNVLLSFETRWAMAPGWELYNSFILDQAQTPGETGGATGYPAAWGNLGGVSWVHPYREGRWETFIEGVYTNPWLYTHYQPETRFTFSRYIFSKTEYTLELPLGYETGPDTTRLAAGLGYRVPGNWGAQVKASWTREGSTSVYVTYPGGYSEPYPDGYVSPPGTPDQITWKVSVNGEKKLKNITIGGYAAWLDRLNVKDNDNNHIPGSHLDSLELALSGKLTY